MSTGKQPLGLEQIILATLRDSQVGSDRVELPAIRRIGREFGDDTRSEVDKWLRRLRLQIEAVRESRE